MNSLKPAVPNLGKIDGRVEVPSYSLASPDRSILHLGVGNFHRSHQAYYLHRLLQLQDSSWRICGAGLMPQDLVMKEALEDQDYLYTLVTQESGREDACLIGSLRDYIHIPTEFERFLQTCSDGDLKILSLTITEKGYCFDNDMNLDRENPGIRHDLTRAETPPVTAVGVLAYALKKRLAAGGAPLTLLSCDNIPENGSVLKRILFQYAELLEDSDLLGYLKNSVTFPCTMVDRITPNTSEEKITYLQEQYGILDRVPVFAEQFIQWVIEDRFIAGRPEWEKVDAAFVEDVKPYELMKIRLLNGGHSAMSYLSLLSGYNFVDEAMDDRRIKLFLRGYMGELKQTLTRIPGMDFETYIETLLERFANPAVRDRLLRLAEDGSTKILNSMMTPLEILLERGEGARYITAALAGWICYLHLSLENRESVVNDPIRDKLREAAADPVNNIQDFLAIREVFPAKIAENREFAEGLQFTVERILKEGVREVLKDYN